MKELRSLILCVVVSQALNVAGLELFNFDPGWDALRVTYTINSEMPLKRSKANAAGFEQIGGSDAPCSGDFLGYRYMKDDDPAVIVMYDVNGYVAGIQNSFTEQSIANTDVRNWFKQSPMFTVEELTLKNNKTMCYTLTAYLVDPEIICTTGRSAQQYEENEAGINLFLKNGTKNVAIPKKQSELSRTSWTLGRCFPAMGVHYWYNTSKDMNCDYFQPVFLLYNREKLTGFGWAALGHFSSKRYEHPPQAALRGFLKEVPDCLLSSYDKMGGISTEHVYMNSKPWNLIC